MWSLSFVLLSALGAQQVAAVDEVGWVSVDNMGFFRHNDSLLEMRGCNVANWLLQEMWMNQVWENDGYDEHTLEEKFIERFGLAGKETLVKAWRDNWITERDFDMISSFGFNVVRIPFRFTVIENYTNTGPVDDGTSGTWKLRDDAWTYLDWAIDMAEARGMWTILDLHGAPGSQSTRDHSGRSNYNKLWDSTKNYRARAMWLWEQVATKYANRTAVAGFDLLNEPWGADDVDMLEDYVQEMITTIRAVDDKHVIIMPDFIDHGFSFYKSRNGWTNMAYTSHPYPGIYEPAPNTVELQLDFYESNLPEWSRITRGHGVGLLLGEMNVLDKVAGGGEMMRYAYDNYGERGYATTMWCYKYFSASGGVDGSAWGMVTNTEAMASFIVANTWACPGWDSNFDEACAASRVVVTPRVSGTYYLVVKGGYCCGGAIDMQMDYISLKHNGMEHLTNGNFTDGVPGWSVWSASGNMTISFDAGLRYTGDQVVGDSNGGVYQAVQLTAGEDYTINGTFRDLGGQDTWTEIYLWMDEPVDGEDYLGEKRNSSLINPGTSDFGTIEDFFRSQSSTEYVVDEDLRAWMSNESAVPRWPRVVDPPTPDSSKPLSAGAVVAIIIGVLFLIILIVCCCKRANKSGNVEGDGLLGNQEPTYQATGTEDNATV